MLERSGSRRKGSKSLYDFFEGIGLLKKVTAFRHTSQQWLYLTGHDNEFDRRPSIASNRSEFKPSHYTGQIYVGEDNTNVGPGLQELHCLLGSHRRDGLEPGLVHSVDSLQQEQDL